MTAPEHHALALIATLRRRKTDTPIEQLDDPAALRAWLQDRDFEVSACTAEQLGEVRALREEIFEVVEAAAVRRRPRPGALDAVNAAASRRSSVPRLRWDGEQGFHLARRRYSAADALADIAGRTVELLTGPLRDRLHQCEADACGTVFALPVSGRPRRWCASATCGNRERVQAHRLRRGSVR